MIKRNRTLWALALVVTILSTQITGAQKSPEPRAGAKMSPRQKASHALNRLTFGPRPGDVDRVLSQGLDRWIDQQLHPERISNTQAESRLAEFRTLSMSPRELVENYPPPQVIRAIAEGRMSLPNDPEKRAVYEAQTERFRRQQRERTQDAEPGMMPEPGMPGDGPPRRMPDPDLQGIGRGMRNPTQIVVSEVAQAKLLRAAYSERQLEEVLTDFWFNHFNVFIGKGPDRYLVTGYERDAIRPHVFGKFKDMLVATARHPAMLFYLDNWQSVGPNSRLARNQPLRNRFAQRRRQQGAAQPQQQPPRGLNENYARELMELHTLGVDSGYTQKDITELARVFSGWTIDQPRRGGGFIYRAVMHEPGAKTVLGKRISESGEGEKEGMQVLEMLARHPATARFLSSKLAQRFVSDDPPPALVARMAKTFLATDGDLREVYRSMLRSPEFWDSTAYRAKVKTPLEFVASSIRASGAQVSSFLPLLRALEGMGMPLYGAQPPTGYSTKSEAWVNSAALLSRMNFALALAGSRLPGVSFDPEDLLGELEDADPAMAPDALGITLLAGNLSPTTRATIERQLQDPATLAPEAESAQKLSLLTGLILGSPEFQRR